MTVGTFAAVDWVGSQLGGILIGAAVAGAISIALSIRRRHIEATRPDDERRIRKLQEEVAEVVREGPGLLYRVSVKSVDDRQLLFVSENSTAIIGFTPEEMMLPGWYVANMSPDVRQRSWENILNAMNHGQSSYEYRNLDPQAGWRWSRNNVRYVQQRPDNRHEFVGYSVDITAEKENANQLAQASKLATLGELATGMAHELSQPLASISMAAENAMLSLEANPSNSELIGQKLARISQEAMRAAKLVAHMRRFGRRESSGAGPVELATAIDGALTIMDGRLRKTRTTVQCDIEPDLPKVMGSVVMIEQVLMNLLTNACDAFRASETPAVDDRRQVEVRMYGDGPNVVITVADHAGGIKDGDLDKIFAPFFTTKPPGEGTGLGLSISYGIIDDMGGTMTAYNRDDGAIFEIRLPKLADEAPKSVEEAAA